MAPQDGEAEARSLEDKDEVISYAKNYNLGFSIPYTMNGEEKNYYPDFVVRIKTPATQRREGRGLHPAVTSARASAGCEGELNLIVEVTGEHKKDRAAKVSTAKTLWIPAINNHRGFGRWRFIEITDPWNAKNQIRESLRDIDDIEESRE